MVALSQKEILHNIRKEFRKKIPIKSCYLAEAIAYGYGYSTYASLIPDIEKIDIASIDYARVYSRACNLTKIPYSEDFIASLYLIIDNNRNQLNPISLVYKEHADLYKAFTKNLEFYESKLSRVHNNNSDYILSEKREYTTPEGKKYINLWSNQNIEQPPLIWNTMTQSIEEVHIYETLYIPIKAYMTISNILKKHYMKGLTSIEAMRQLNQDRIILYIIETSEPNLSKWSKQIIFTKYKKIFQIIMNHYCEFGDSDNIIKCFVHPIAYRWIPEPSSDNAHLKYIDTYFKCILNNISNPKIDFIADFMFFYLRAKRGIVFININDTLFPEQQSRTQAYKDIYLPVCHEDFISVISRIMIKPEINFLQIEGEGSDFLYLSNKQIEDIYKAILEL